VVEDLLVLMPKRLPSISQPIIKAAAVVLHRLTDHITEAAQIIMQEQATNPASLASVTASVAFAKIAVLVPRIMMGNAMGTSRLAEINLD